MIGINIPYLQGGDTIQGNKYRHEGVQAQQYQQREAKRKEEEALSRSEMRPVLIKKATRAEKIKGKKDKYKTQPRVIGMSGRDPLLGFAFDMYTGGKGIQSVGKAIKHYTPKVKLLASKTNVNKLGSYLGEGGEQTVYDSGEGYVYKVFGKEYNATNLKQLQDMITTYQYRNRSKLSLPVEYHGYVKQNGKYYPVFKQQKASNAVEDYCINPDRVDRKITEALEDAGYPTNSSVYTMNSDHALVDITPENVGFVDGQLRFIDVPVIPRQPGEKLYLSERLKKYINGLDDDIDWVNSHNPGRLERILPKGWDK